MIVSHKYRFIFIKTRKTAGTSIEVGLNSLLGPEDIATPLMPMPAYPDHRAQNHIITDDQGKTHHCYHHMTAEEVRAVIGQSRFSDYFKFCVEREPVDKTISHYSMWVNSPQHNLFKRGMKWDHYIRLRRYPVDTKRYTDHNQDLMVDRILKYETLTEELADVMDLVGCHWDFSHRAMSGFRIDVSASHHHQQLIYDRFASSNRFTGYQLPPQSTDH